MNDEWTIVFEDSIDGILLQPGTQFKLVGERGKTYTYVRTVTNQEGSTWIDCFGGGKTQSSRSVHHGRVRVDSISPKRKLSPEKQPEPPPPEEKPAPRRRRSPAKPTKKASRGSSKAAAGR